jgi:hypothetical protein
MSHVALLNIAWDCLAAPVIEQYWTGRPMNYRIQFRKDNPEYNPLKINKLQ